MCAETADEGDTPAAIMDATYAALCKHGYANLTIQAIADEFAKSKSLLYYHYDTKDDILVALLEYMVEEYTLEDIIDTSQPADEQLESFVDGILPATLDDEDRTFQKALLELRFQAVSEERYREQFTQLDRRLADTVATILEDGIETGVFRDLDVDTHAEMFVSLVNGAMLRRTTTETEDVVSQARRATKQYVRSQLLADTAE